MSTERRPVAFNKFGGLRLDVPPDEVGGEEAILSADCDWVAGPGALVPRKGFLLEHEPTPEGVEKVLGIFAHTPTRRLAIVLYENGDQKITAWDPSGSVLKEAAWPGLAGPSTFVRFGSPGASYTYARSAEENHKVIRYDGSVFTEPSCSVDGVTGKEMPKGKCMAAWPAGGDRLVIANTGSTGGPGGAASSNSHVWFSEPEGKAEAYESTAYVQLSPGDGEEITAAVVYGGVVFVFKETKFFRFYGIDIDEEGRPVFRFTEESLGEGVRLTRQIKSGSKYATSDQLACVGPGGVYFCTSDGVYMTRGAGVAKISNALAALEQEVEFDGPMCSFLEGESETFRWPARGIECIGNRLYVAGYEFTFVYDLVVGAWVSCWKQPRVSMCVAQRSASTAPHLFITTGKGIYWTARSLSDNILSLASPTGEWQSGFYDLDSQDEKELVGARAFGRGAIDAESFSDLGEEASPSKGHFELPTEGTGTVYDDNALTDSGVMFSHRLTLEPGSRAQRITRYLRETRTPGTLT